MSRSPSAAPARATSRRVPRRRGVPTRPSGGSRRPASRRASALSAGSVATAMSASSATAASGSSRIAPASASGSIRPTCGETVAKLSCSAASRSRLSVCRAASPTRDRASGPLSGPGGRLVPGGDLRRLRRVRRRLRTPDRGPRWRGPRRAAGRSPPRRCGPGPRGPARVRTSRRWRRRAGRRGSVVGLAADGREPAGEADHVDRAADRRADPHRGVGAAAASDRDRDRHRALRGRSVAGRPRAPAARRGSRSRSGTCGRRSTG